MIQRIVQGQQVRSTLKKILKTSSHAIRYAENEILGVIRTPRFIVKLLVIFKLLRAMAVASTVCGGRGH